MVLKDETEGLVATLSFFITRGIITNGLRPETHKERSSLCQIECRNLIIVDTRWSKSLKP